MERQDEEAGDRKQEAGHAANSKQKTKNSKQKTSHREPATCNLKLPNLKPETGEMIFFRIFAG